MVYDISHRTTYRYSIPVSCSHHLLHLTPRSSERQVCHRTVLTISPTPAQHATSIDYFGNIVAFITVQEQHNDLTVQARSIIEVTPPAPIDPKKSAAWETIFPLLTRSSGSERQSILQFVFDSPYTAVSVDLERYARVSFPPGRPVIEGAVDLTRRIFKEFKYNPTATTVTTPVDEVFEKRHGVCQDFAHLQIAALRTLRLPARYVSGYLMTRPPEGKEKLIGADASHAWVSVWCPEFGWVDLDPTNNMMVTEEHITLAWGRDYGDVSPVKGAIFGGGTHAVEVGVDVAPINDQPRHGRADA